LLQLRSVNREYGPLRATRTNRIGMNQSNSRFRQIGKIVNALRISLSHDDHERSLVNDSITGQLVPVGSDKATFLKSLRVAFDRENRNFCGSPLQDLVGDGFRAGE